MPRIGPLYLLLALSHAGCGYEIVLGDTSAPTPTGAVGSGPFDLPPPGELLWSSDHEIGNFSDWEGGGDFYGGQYEWGDVSGYVDAGVGRGATSGVVAQINTLARDETSAGMRLYRRIEGAPAYYRAWFRLAEAHVVSDWWSIFLFHSRDDSLSLDNDISLWDVRVVGDRADRLELQFFDHDTMQGSVAIDGRGHIQPGQWFELSAYLDYRPPDATRLVVWLDGVPLFDRGDLHTAAQDNVFWCVGNGAGRLSPTDSTLYLDDAAVLGTDAP